MNKVVCLLLFSIFSILFISSCSSTKYVGDGEYLLDKVEIITDNDTHTASDLKPYVKQQPNFKTFGLLKWQLYVYDWSGKNEKRWLSKQLRRIGEAPVIMDTTLVNATEEELKRFMTNKGYPHSEVTVEIDTTKRKKATVKYNITSNSPYVVSPYKNSINDAFIDSISMLKPQKRSVWKSAFKQYNDDYTALVKDGISFDLDVLDAERQRITTLLRRNGYYAFNRDYLSYIADTTSGNNEVDLEMILRPYRKQLEDGSIVDAPHRRYYINDVTIVTDYDPLTNNSVSNIQQDTLKFGNVDIVYPNGKKHIRPSVLLRANYLTPGSLFNERNVEQTYASLAALQTLRNVNIRFDEIEVNDTMRLNCTILTSPAKTQGFGIDIEGTNSAGDLGFASSVNYKHRNLFRGSEVFALKLRGAYEAISGSSEGNSYWEYGVEQSLLFPRFVFPFVNENFRRKVRATTELKISYNMQTRPEFQRAIFSAGWNYIWQERNNTPARHVFKLIDLDYVHLPKISQSFKDSLPESTLLYNFTDQFIVGTGYTYSFNNNYSIQNGQRDTHSMRFSFEMAGNALYALSKLTGANKDSEGRYDLFGINYAQFVKADVSFSKCMILDNRNKLAYHVGVGVGVPYGNSKMLPFERSYFAGGANSVRGWSVRALGPGGMLTDSISSFAQQVGDIRLDLSVEYRTKLFWKFEAAAFVDAGNIWTFHVDETRPDGNFSFSRFYKEIAVGYGLGLRLDFDFFLLRLDGGLKAYNPQVRGKDRWAILHPNLNDNFALHFAVGYPF